MSHKDDHRRFFLCWITIITYDYSFINFRWYFQIKKIINQSYKKLEIDIDGIFMKLLLLKKKKYAGLAVDLNDEEKTKREIKGLDIVRRDYSFIVKQIGK